MAAPMEKKRKLGHAKDSEFKGIIVYIVPTKIQKKRLESIYNCAKSLSLTVLEKFSSQVTHILTELESCTDVVDKLCEEEDLWCEETEVLRLQWLFDSKKHGEPVSVEQYRLKHKKQRKETKSLPEEEKFPEWACLRATPLKHLNEKLTNALEILETNAKYRDDDLNKSRGLAFRRGSAVLKSLPFTVTSVNQVKGLPDIGKHCLAVIQAIVEDGYSEEVEEIERNSWFKLMQCFTAVYGSGPKTSERWIHEGMTSIDDVINAENLRRKEDPQVAMGLSFYEDLNTVVTKSEAQAVRDFIYNELTKIQEGMTVDLCGGFRRGKTTGHDIDLLISHPDEGTERGVLVQLMERLDQRGMVLHGSISGNTYNEEVLKSNPKSNLTTTMDHFEKWMGVLKVNKVLQESSKTEQDEKQKESNDDKALSNKNESREEEANQNDTNHSAQSHYDIMPQDCEVIPPSCRRQVSVGTSAQGNALQDSLELAKPRFERKTSLTAAFELSRSARDWTARRLDLIMVPASQYYYALVGWTGNRQFNRSLRLYGTQKMNMKLSSHGLWDYNQKCALPASSEKEVFDHLKVPYREPQDRNC